MRVQTNVKERRKKIRSFEFQRGSMIFQDSISNFFLNEYRKLASFIIISFCVDMHPIDAKCKSRIIASLFHFCVDVDDTK